MGEIGTRRRTLAERLDIKDKDLEAVRTKAGENLRALILAAALGRVPEDKMSEKNHFQSHAKSWFKSADGGRELAGKMFSLGVWPALKLQLMPFCNAFRKAVDLAEIQDLDP